MENNNLRNVKTIPRYVINNVLRETDITSVIGNFVNLSRKHKGFVGLCPFHGDKNPSFNVSPEKNIYKCFSCGEGGNVVTFLKKYKNYTYPQAIEYLAEQIDYQYDFSKHKNVTEIIYTEDQLGALKALNLANNQYKLEVFKNPLANEYLTKRGLDNEIREYFNIGFSPKNGIQEELINKLGFEYNDLLKSGIINEDFKEIIINRITFGIENHRGEIVAFSGRNIDNKRPNEVRKYINSPSTEFFNKSSILYNFAKAKESINFNKEVIITEGFMDVIALYKSEIKNAVSLMGTSLTKEQLQSIKKYNITLFLDNDNAGIEATKKSIKLLLENQIKPKVIVNNLQKDADEIYSLNGKDELIKVVSKSVSAIDYVYKNLINLYLEDREITSQDSKNFTDEFLSYLKYYEDREKDFFRIKVFNKYHFDILYNDKNNINNLNQNIFKWIEPETKVREMVNTEGKVIQTKYLINNYSRINNDFFETEYIVNNLLENNKTEVLKYNDEEIYKITYDENENILDLSIKKPLINKNCSQKIEIKTDDKEIIRDYDGFTIRKINSDNSWNFSWNEDDNKITRTLINHTKNSKTSYIDEDIVLYERKYDWSNEDYTKLSIVIEPLKNMMFIKRVNNINNHVKTVEKEFTFLDNDENTQIVSYYENLNDQEFITNYKTNNYKQIKYEKVEKEMVI